MWDPQICVEFATFCDREAIYYDFKKYNGLLPHIWVLRDDALAIVKSLSDQPMCYNGEMTMRMCVEHSKMVNCK